MIDFVSPQKCNEHLNNHVLTPPENESWGIVWQGDYQVLAGGHQNDNACYRLRNELAAEPSQQISTLIVELRNRYLESANQCIKNASKTQWFARSNNESVMIDTNGILCSTINNHGCNTIKTCFIPGRGNAPAVMASKSTSDPHARAKGNYSAMRGDGLNSSSKGKRWKKNHTTTQRAATRGKIETAEQRLYYFVFKPAMKFIRARQIEMDPESLVNLHGSSFDYFRELKQVLPRLSQLSFEHWTALREGEQNA